MKWLEYIKNKYSCNNFYNVWIVVNNRVRKKQVKDSIIREMPENSNIIPPQVLDYKLAFLYLAAEICLGVYNKEKINEYSEEWIEFFTYQIAESVVKEIETKEGAITIPSELREAPNLIRHLAKDLRSFIRDIVYYVIDIENIKNNIPQYDNDFVTHYFLEGLKKYIRLENEHNPEQNKTFLTPLHAYRSLYNKIKNKKGNFDTQNINLPNVMIIEDFDDVEPIFKEIVGNLENLIKIEKFNKFAVKYENNNYEIVGFINSVDETEFIVNKVIELLGKQTPAEDIGIVVCNSEIEDLLDLTFHRFGIVLDRNTPLWLSAPFRATFSFFKIFAKDQNPDFITISETDIDNIFNNECSKFYIPGSYHSFLSYILSTGKRFYNSPVEVIKEVIEETKNMLNNNDKDKIDSFIKLISQLKINENLLTTIIENLLNFNEIHRTSLFTQFFSTIDEINKILKKQQVDEIIDICYNLFLIAAKREYIETKVKDENNTWEHFIPVVRPEHADNITAKHLFICGLDGNFDKQFLASTPEYLINIINQQIKNEYQKIPNTEEITKKIYKKLDNAIKNANEVYLTFSYYDLSNKEKGISNYLYQQKFEIYKKIQEFKKAYEEIYINTTSEQTQNQNIEQYAEEIQDNFSITVDYLLKK